MALFYISTATVWESCYTSIHVCFNNLLDLCVDCPDVTVIVDWVVKTIICSLSINL